METCGGHICIYDYIHTRVCYTQDFLWRFAHTSSRHRLLVAFRLCSSMKYLDQVRVLHVMVYIGNQRARRRHLLTCTVTRSSRGQLLRLYVERNGLAEKQYSPSNEHAP